MGHDHRGSQISLVTNQKFTDDLALIATDWNTSELLQTNVNKNTIIVYSFCVGVS